LSQDQEIQREILPIPDRPYTGLVPYDAKDPDTSFPPIEPLRPPAGAPNVLDADHLISPEERLQIAMARQ
jgi:arylsulfatase